MNQGKPFEIPKALIWEAWLKVKGNQGAAGIDQCSIEEYEQDLKSNLYKLWNRMSSGSYFPKPIRQVDIPKSDGKKRTLGIASVEDRVAQTAATLVIEPQLDPHFHEDMYGYRANKSAHQALAVTRKRCWRYDWLLDLDIQSYFPSVSHELLMKAVRHHVKEPWILLYLQRWITGPVQESDGSLSTPICGVPQGAPVSPVLSNLFMHYAVVKWLERTYPSLPFAVYADDAVIHCRSEAEAQQLLRDLKERLWECQLTLHPDKTQIVYCKDEDRQGEHEQTSFDFLGYTFRPRKSKNRYGKFFINFSPGVSPKAAKRIRKTAKNWQLPCRVDKSIEDLSRMFNATIQGWLGYFTRFYKSALYPSLRYLNQLLVRWATSKYKRLKRHRRRARHWLGRLARRQPNLFAHWKLGVLPEVEQ